MEAPSWDGRLNLADGNRRIEMIFYLFNVGQMIKDFLKSFFIIYVLIISLGYLLR